MSAETDRGAAIIRRALELMRQGLARSWSHALELARQEQEASRWKD